MTRWDRAIVWLSGADVEMKRRWAVILTYSLLSGGVLFFWQVGTSFLAPWGLERLGSAAALLSVPLFYLALRNKRWGPMLLTISIMSGFAISMVFSWGVTSGLFLLATVCIMYAAELTTPFVALWVTGFIALAGVAEGWAVSRGYLMVREGTFVGALFPTWLAICILISGSLITLAAAVNDRFLKRINAHRIELEESVRRQKIELARQRELSELCRGILGLEDPGELVGLIVGAIARALDIEPERISLEGEWSESAVDSLRSTSVASDGAFVHRLPVQIDEALHAVVVVRVPSPRQLHSDELDFLSAICGVASVAYDRRSIQQRRRDMLALSVQQKHLATLGGLISGIAHDINNPTSVMLLNVQTARRLLADAWQLLDAYASAPQFGVAHAGLELSRDGMADVVNRIEQGVRRIQGLIEELSRAARADIQASEGRADVRCLVEEAIRLLEYRRYAQGIEVEIRQVGLDGVPEVSADSDEIRLAIMHLLNNAYDALEGGGELVGVSLESVDHGIAVIVEDDGSGIPAESFGRVTEPFYTTRRDAGRRGLGLFRVSRIVDAYGGRLTIEPRRGGGTRAKLWLPASAAS